MTGESRLPAMECYIHGGCSYARVESMHEDVHGGVGARNRLLCSRCEAPENGCQGSTRSCHAPSRLRDSRMIRNIESHSHHDAEVLIVCQSLRDQVISVD